MGRGFAEPYKFALVSKSASNGPKVMIFHKPNCSGLKHSFLSFQMRATDASASHPVGLQQHAFRTSGRTC